MSRNLKSVCFVTQTTGFGGVEIHTSNLIGALIGRGYSIELIQCRHTGYDRLIVKHGWQDKVRLIHLNIGVNGPTTKWREVIDGLSSTTLIFPKGGTYMGSVGFLWLCRRSFRSIFIIEHLEAPPVPTRFSRKWFGIFPGLGLWWYRQWLLKKVWAFFANRVADRIIAVSHRVKARLLEEGPYTPDRIAVVHNGVDWKSFERDAGYSEVCRARWGVPVDAFVFGMITRLVEVKGIDIALRAFRAFLDKEPPTRAYLVIAGEGRDADALKKLAVLLDLRDSVKFIGFTTGVREILSAFDIILFSSRLEGLPIGLLEGMAAGCIPIITHVSGMPEVVTGRDIGFVVAPEDPDELCSAMQEAIALDSISSAKLRQSVVRRIRENFDLETCNRRILDICGL